MIEPSELAANTPSGTRACAWQLRLSIDPNSLHDGDGTAVGIGDAMGACSSAPGEHLPCEDLPILASHERALVWPSTTAHCARSGRHSLVGERGPMWDAHQARGLAQAKIVRA